MEDTFVFGDHMVVHYGWMGPNERRMRMFVFTMRVNWFSIEVR